MEHDPGSDTRDAGGPSGSGQPPLDVNELLATSHALHYQNVELQARLRAAEEAAECARAGHAHVHDDDPATGTANSQPHGQRSLFPKPQDLPKLTDHFKWRKWLYLVFATLSVYNGIKVEDYHKWAPFGLEAEFEWWHADGYSAYLGLVSGPEAMAPWLAFCEVIKQRFQDPQENQKALYDLEHLRQKFSKANVFTLCTFIDDRCRDLDFSPGDVLKIHWLRRAIDPSVAAHVSLWDCGNFSRVRDACVQAEASLRASQPVTRSGSFHPAYQSGYGYRRDAPQYRAPARPAQPHFQHPAPAAPAPMELGLMQRQRRTPALSSERPRGRFPHGTCYNCGSPEHFWRGCPVPQRTGLGRHTQHQRGHQQQQQQHRPLNTSGN